MTNLSDLLKLEREEFENLVDEFRELTEREDTLYQSCKRFIKAHDAKLLQAVRELVEGNKITCGAHERTSSDICLCEVLDDNSSACFNYNQALQDILESLTIKEL